MSTIQAFNHFKNFKVKNFSNVTGSTNPLVQSALTTVTEKYELYKQALSDYEKTDALLKEFQRQLQYHVSNGDTVNAGIVQTRLQGPSSQLPVLENAKREAYASYNEALKEYNKLSAQLVSETEKKELDAQLAAQKAAADSASVSAAKKESDNAMLKKILWGLGITAGVALLITVIVKISRSRKGA